MTTPWLLIRCPTCKHILVELYGPGATYAVRAFCRHCRPKRYVVIRVHQGSVTRLDEEVLAPNA